LSAANSARNRRDERPFNFWTRPDSAAAGGTSASTSDTIGHHLDLDHLTTSLGYHLSDDLLQSSLDRPGQYATAVLRAPDDVVLRRVHRLVGRPVRHRQIFSPICDTFRAAR